MFAYCGNNPICRTDYSGKNFIYDIWNSAEDFIWKVEAGILYAFEYTLTGDLLNLAASGPNNSYFSSGNDYASNLILSDKAFIQTVSEEYYNSQHNISAKWSISQSYTFNLTSGDLGAALHHVNYRYYVDYNWINQNANLIVEITDTFDFTEFKNPFSQKSLAAAFLWFVNDIAYIDSAWGLLDPVPVTIMISIPIEPWR